jgi:hypothetical protein
MDIVMQRENEHRRIVVDGRRTDDRSRCELLLVSEVGGTWALYPHGSGHLGVRLPTVEAVRIARAILGEDVR